MATLLDVRETLAETLRGFVASDVTVYPYPAETIALPAVVIVPDDPWWTPAALGPSPTSRVRVNFELQLLTVRGEVEMGFGELETLMVAVGAALTADGAFRWVDSSQPTTIEANEIPALMAAVSCYTHV